MSPLSTAPAHAVPRALVVHVRPWVGGRGVLGLREGEALGASVCVDSAAGTLSRTMHHRYPPPLPAPAIRYIEQFVLYHLFIGVELIYLYDNEDEPTYHTMFRCNPRVKVGLGCRKR